MHFSILKFVGIAALSALCAVMAIFRDLFRIGEDPSDDGPRALIAQFFGFWIGCNFLLWSFMANGKALQWTLRGVGAAAALVGIVLSTYFAETTEVPETPDKELTGFKSDTTDLHLE